MSRSSPSVRQFLRQFARQADVRSRFMLDISVPVGALRFWDAVPVGPRQQFRSLLYISGWWWVLSWLLVDCGRGWHVAGAAGVRDALSGGAGSPGWGGDQCGCPPLWGVAADGACLVAPVCARWGGAESGGPLVASAPVSASDGAWGIQLGCSSSVRAWSIWS
jgi:hypothetical protein